jgi:hypothetical protein
MAFLEIILTILSALFIGRRNSSHSSGWIFLDSDADSARNCALGNLDLIGIKQVVTNSKGAN